MNPDISWRPPAWLDPWRRWVAPPGSRQERWVRNRIRQLERWKRTRRLASAAQSPDVTLLLPLDGSDADDLSGTIASVVAQTAGAWELCLTGRAPTLVDLPDDPRIRRCPSDGDRAEGLNAGLAAARGTFVATLEAGDTLLPEALQTMLRAPAAQDAAILYSDEDSIGLEGPAGTVLPQAGLVA